MQVIKDIMKSTSDKENSYNVQAEMKVLNLPFDSTPKDFLNNFGIETDLPNEFKYDDLEKLPDFWNAVKHEIAKNEMFDLESKKSISNSDLKDLGFQKVTYLIDDNEDYQTILNTLKEQKTNALLRAVVGNQEEREITVYASRFGVWKDPTNSYRAKLNTGAETNGQIRYTFTARGQKDISNLVNIGKGFNYAVYEDISNLFENDLINNVNGIISKLHLKLELSEEEIKQAEVKQEATKEVKQEVSHTNKEMKPTNAKTSEMVATIEKNENKLVSTDDRDLSVDRADMIEELETDRVELINSYLTKQMKDLEDKQAKEKALLEEKINSVMKNRLKIKQDAILLLQNGMNLQEMNVELASKKYNDLEIQIINEELKKEIIDSVDKENKLKQISKDLVVFVEKNEKLEKSKGYFKEQFENMQKNLSGEQANHKVTKGELFNTIKLLENSTVEFESQKSLLLSTVQDLKAEKLDLQKEYDFIEAEIEEKIETIQNKEKDIILLTEKISSKDEIINEKNETILEKSKIVEEQKETIKSKDEEIKEVKAEKIDIQEQLKQSQNMLEKLMADIERDRIEAKEVINKLKTANSQLFAENKQLKEQLSNFNEMKKELEQLRKNEEINKGYKEKIEKTKEEIKVNNEDDFKSKLEGFNVPKYNFGEAVKKDSNNNNI